MSQPKIARSKIREAKRLKQRLKSPGVFVTLVVHPSGVPAAVCANRWRAVQWRGTAPGGDTMELIDLEVIS